MENMIYGSIIIFLLIVFTIFLPIYIICCFKHGTKEVEYSEL